MNWRHALSLLMIAVFLSVGLFVMTSADRGANADDKQSKKASNDVKEVKTGRKQKAETASDSKAGQNVAISGVVKLVGPRPKRSSIAMFEKGKLSDCSKLHTSKLLAENVLVGANGGLANAFIYVKKGLDKKQTYPMPKKPAYLDQQKCMFRPRVQGIRVGQDFVMRNDDPLIHNVRSLSFRNRPFNIAQPKGSEDRKKVFKRAERAVQVQCDIHGWMTAYVFIMDNPFFAVSDAKGNFEIKGLPQGDYTLGAWHEEFRDQKTEIKVKAGAVAKVAFAFLPTAKKDD